MLILTWKSVNIHMCVCMFTNWSILPVIRHPRRPYSEAFRLFQCTIIIGPNPEVKTVVSGHRFIGRIDFPTSGKHRAIQWNVGLKHTFRVIICSYSYFWKARCKIRYKNRNNWYICIYNVCWVSLVGYLNINLRF